MEGVLSWKRLCILLIALVVLQFTFLFSTRTGHSSPPHVFNRPQHSDPTFSRPHSWKKPGHKFPSTSPEYSQERCDAEFPKLYALIDKAVAYWQERNHTIGPNDVSIKWREDGAVHILIHRNELRIIQNKGTWENHGYRVRALAILSLIQRALESATRAGEILPTIETAIVVDDMSGLDGFPHDNHTLWTWASNKNDPNHARQWLVPDFNFFSSPATGSYTEQLRMAKEHVSAWEDKDQKVIWRGVTWTNDAVRGSLVDRTKGKYWADVKVIDWATREHMIPMEDHCKYAFTVHTEGRSYSGRLPFLLNCDSVPIIHDLDWSGHFYHLLEPKGKKQNYIPAHRDFSDLEEKVEYLLDTPKEAERIIQNSIATFRDKYLTSDATNCYIRKLVERFSEVSFEPNATRPGGGEMDDRIRGVAFEAWVHMDHDYKGDT